MAIGTLLGIYSVNEVSTELIMEETGRVFTQSHHASTWLDNSKDK